MVFDGFFSSYKQFHQKLELTCPHRYIRNRVLRIMTALFFILREMSNQESEEIVQRILELSRTVTNDVNSQRTFLRAEIKRLQDFLALVSDVGHLVSDSEEETALLKSQIAQAKTDLEKLTGTEASLNQEKCRKEKAMEAMKQKQKESMKDAKVDHPRALHSVNLYKDISRLHLYTDHKPNEVKGYICSTSNARTFRFDESKQSQFFITNNLWEMCNGETS